MHAVTKHRRSFARFMRWLMCMLGVYFLITAILSLTVDPWRINNSPLAIDSFDPYREISETVRTGKAALANKGGWETVIIGSSRMEIAFDPAHPAFKDQLSVNLAMAAATLTETVPVAHYALDRNPEIRTILFGIEPGDLHNNSDSRKFTDFYNSPFSDNNRSIERTINQVIGGRSLANSIATIRNRSAGVVPKRNQLGLWIQPAYPPDLRAYVENAFALGHKVTGENWNLRPQDLRSEKVESLTRLIDRIRAAGIDLHLVIPAQHALKMIHPTEDVPTTMPWEADLLELVRICKNSNAKPSKAPPVKLWNFLLFNKYTCAQIPAADAEKRQLTDWTDFSHAKTSIGNQAIDVMFSDGSDKDGTHRKIGRNLLLGDWKKHQSSWIEAHREYCISGKKDIEWWRGLLSASKDDHYSVKNSQ